ncbi:hypothetical protein HHK36_031306 [Tetracentron sinense]|uniref:Replication factor C subunit 3 n=1 Tax=Tetracentron sinense TaxID=13715 RepID=A0A834Y963_TETSI|nr:hypothetical protein HHK36_031306 [Tetracentron sinense]
MLTMEHTSRYSRASQSHSSSLKQRRSGYEPSDTESEWQETPCHDLKNGNHRQDGALISGRPVRNTSPLSLNQRYSLKPDHDLYSPVIASKITPPRRRNSKSPYKGRNEVNVVPPKSNSRNISPLTKSERRRHISPYKTGREEPATGNEEFMSSGRKQNQRLPHKYLDSEENGTNLQLQEASRVSEKSNYSRRSVSAPKARTGDKEQHINIGHTEQRGDRSRSPLSRNLIRKQREASYVKAPSASEINEMFASVLLSKRPISDAIKEESTESFSLGDVFFSRDCKALNFQKPALTKTSGFESSFAPEPKVISESDAAAHQEGRANGSFGRNSQVVSSNIVLSRSTTASTTVSRQSSGKISTKSSKMSDASRRTSGSSKEFTANRRKNQTKTWFACMKREPFRTSKSPKTREFDEASFIEKALVVESLGQFWADKHQPGSLNGFTCHKQQAQLLKQLVSHKNCPHILFKGPSGSGRKALTMALLCEIYGDPAWNISHDLRYFHIQEKRLMQVVVPLTSSAHHVELNLNSEPAARYALMALVKEITTNYAITPEVSTTGFRPDYKVIVLYEVDKVAENVQHLIKWIMDCYTDACKLILSCEDDVNILESVKSRCKVIKVDAPITHEIMEVLIQIARKENFELSMSFAAKIATKSKQNLRKAIMALEACKAHNYPFVDEQPIPLGWEEVLEELAAEILADPSPKRLFFTRGKFQKLLVDFVHPKLILQKLVEQFLKGVEASLKREVYYWHAYYDKRLPTGTSALLKLEEFVAKFMSIYRKSFSNRSYQ